MLELVASQQQRQFGLDKRDTLPQYCLDCDVRFACHGGCPKDRFIATPDGEPGLNYLCPGFKDFFHHVDGPMRIMGELLAAEPRALRDRAALRGRGRQARPQRPLHLRLRPQVEALPRDVDAAGQTERSRVMKEEPMSQTIKTSTAAENSRPAARVDHFTVEERVARGKAARGEVPRSTHAAWEPPKDRQKPGRAARGAGADARAGAGADPLRADARVAVHVLPGRGLPDGVRPVGSAPHRPAHAAVRGRASVELRRLRGARPAARVQHQRLRRDAARARSSGT